MKRMLTSTLTVALALTIASGMLAGPLSKAVGPRTSCTVSECVQTDPSPIFKGLPWLPTKTAQSISNSQLFQANRMSKPHSKFRAPLRAPESFPEINGVVVFSNAWGSENLTGMYRIPMSEAATTQEIKLGVKANDGAAYLNNRFYGLTSIALPSSTIPLNLVTWDTETWEQIETHEYNRFMKIYYATAEDPTTGIVYGVTPMMPDGVSPAWSKLNYENATVENLAECSNMYMGLGFDAQGNCYGVSKTDQGAFFGKVDKANGAFTPLSEMTRDLAYKSSGCMDSKTGRFFMNICNAEGSYMQEIDPATGEVVYEYQLPDGEEIIGMYVAKPLAESDAPAKVENLQVLFEDGNLTGSVKFTMPSKTFGGNDLNSGEIEYSVLANGAVVATGDSYAGQSVTESIRVEEVGDYTFTVFCSNQAGQSPKAEVSLYVGNDTPVINAGTARYENGNLIAEWDAVTEGLNGGYIDPGKVTYDVWLHSSTAAEPTQVAKGMSETIVSVPLAKPEEITSYYFTICADFEGLSSNVVKTNTVTLGEILPPYFQSFSDENVMNTFTVIDANADGTTWMLVGGRVKIRYNSTAPMDDYLVTPHQTRKR